MWCSRTNGERADRMSADWRGRALTVHQAEQPELGPIHSFSSLWRPSSASPISAMLSPVMCQSLVPMFFRNMSSPNVSGAGVSHQSSSLWRAIAPSRSPHEGETTCDDEHTPLNGGAGNALACRLRGSSLRSRYCFQVESAAAPMPSGAATAMDFQTDP